MLTCNDAFVPILGRLGPPLMFPAGDAAALADRLDALWQRPRADLVQMGEALRAIVVRDHSLQTWAERTVAGFESLARRPALAPAPAGPPQR